MSLEVLQPGAQLAPASGHWLLGLWAEWCQPSRSLAESLAAVVEQHPQIKVVLADLDQHPLLRERHGIEGLPSVLLYDGDRLLLRRTGILRRDELLSLIATCL